MDFTISRDKNFISFLANNKKKPYVFDINTGIFYSLQSKPLKNLPPKFKTCLNEYETNNMVFALMDRIINAPYYYGDSWSFKISLFTTHVELFKIADKLNSLGYKYNTVEDIDIYNLSIVNKYFKGFVKHFNENNNIKISEFVKYIYPRLWAEEHNITINEVFTLEFIRRILNSHFTDEQINYIINCMRRGVCYYFIDNNYESFNYWQMLDKFQEYFDICKKINIPYEKDFFRGCINAKRMYQTYKLQFDNEAIVDNYKKHNLFFEDDNFTIVIPQTVEDFKNEAIQQNNCVYSCYLQLVINHKTNVIFIRKKDNIEKSFITCEVSNNGNIKQYLLKHNKRVNTNTLEHEFYHKYAKWLKENWV